MTIKELRESKEMTQLYCSAFLKIARRTYQMYEQGDLDIPSGKLSPFCCMFGVDIATFYNCIAETASIDASENTEW